MTMMKENNTMQKEKKRTVVVQVERGGIERNFGQYKDGVYLNKEINITHIRTHTS